MMPKRLWIAVACAASAIAAGCRSVPPIGPGFVYEPEDNEERLWAASREASEEIRQSGKLYKNEAIRAYAQSVLERVLGNNLGAYRPLRPQLWIVDSPEVNAFALPHGDIFVHTGMIGRLRNEAQLAMVLGHEITHATHRHGYQEAEDTYARRGATSYISVLSALGGSNVQSLVNNLSVFITQAAIAGYSREKESEADQVGLTLIAQAGYDPRQGSVAFQQFLDATEEKDKNWHFLYATHPKMKERVESCRTLVDRLPEDLVANAHEVETDRYVSHAATLIYEEVGRHIAQGKFELAEGTLAFTRQDRPEDTRSLCLKGDLYRARASGEDCSKASEAYRAALDVDANCAAAHRGLGLLCRKQGDRAGAVGHFGRYLDLSPHATDAEYIRQYIEKTEDQK